MVGEKLILAVFDFDGTLTEGHLWLGIARHHQAKRVKRRTVLLYFLKHMPYWLASKTGLYSTEKNKTKWGEDLSVLLKGFTEDEATDAFEWVTDNYFMPSMRADVIARLREHRAQGHKVVLLSAMFTDFLKIVGRRLGADFMIGTRLEKINKVYTGRIIPPLCFGENKARLLGEFIRSHKLRVDFSLSTAYADSVHDLPVFRMIGYPVATYPDKELYKIALEQKWPILGHANRLTINHL
jgi:putative phosphoserine phosphatase/1-acylglycerol-3-phosphate O-acyltransferase